jgi:hypothetical protein
MRALIATTAIAAALSNAPLPTWATLPMRAIGATSGLIYLVKSGSPVDRWKREREQSEAIARSQTEFEKWKAQQLKDLQAQADAVNEQLNADKQEFLEQQQQELNRYLDRIDFLETELAAALRQIDELEAPQLPEGLDQSSIAARRTIEILNRLGCTCDYRASWLDSSYIYVKVRPRSGGQREVAKHLDRLQLELDLAEKPAISLVPGAVQLYLRPRSMLPLSEEFDFSPARQWTQEQAVGTLNAVYAASFIEPETKVQPYGDVSQLEKDWVRSLWNRGIRNQKEIISRVWGATSGNGDRFLRARERLRLIAEELGIELRRRDDG